MNRFVATIAACAAPAAALGQAQPFTETFNDGAAGWLNGQFQPLVELPSGGFEGSAFVQTTADLTTDPGTGVTVFRALPSSSGGAFAGDYLAGGIDQLSLYVEHNAGQDVEFFVRFAPPANFPGAFFFAPQAVPSGELTQLTFDLSLDNPLFGAEGAPQDWPMIFDTVFSDVGNIQLVATEPDGFAGPPTVFGLDQVTLIPSPGAAALLCAAGLFGGRRRR